MKTTTRNFHTGDTDDTPFEGFAGKFSETSGPAEHSKLRPSRGHLLPVSQEEGAMWIQML